MYVLTYNLSKPFVSDPSGKTTLLFTRSQTGHSVISGGQKHLHQRDLRWKHPCDGAFGVQLPDGLPGTSVGMHIQQPEEELPEWKTFHTMAKP